MGNDNTSNNIAKKVSFGAAFAVASVWFSTHAGGGFASGNQAIKYFAEYGWYGIFLPILSMFILALVMRESMLMANTRNIRTFSELFKELFRPYTFLELGFEAFYYIIVLAAVGGAIAGAATLFTTLGLSYLLSILIVGSILIVLTIFGAGLVRKAATIMTIAIIVSGFSIYIIGAFNKTEVISQVLVNRETQYNLWLPLWQAVLYCGFQCVSIPAVVACADKMTTKKSIDTAAFYGFILNGLGLGLSVWMLIGWLPEVVAAGQTTLPSLFICNELGSRVLYIFYFVSLFTCFVSTCVTCIYGIVVRLENAVLVKSEGFLSNITNRRVFISLLCILLCMGISVVGLDIIVKYMYSFSGYIALAFAVVPMLTVGYVKNRRWLKEHPEFKG